MNLIEQLIEADCAWIKNKVESLGFTDVVIGISGGKDSTIVAGLCVKALGKEHVHGVMMPCGKQKDIADSRRIIKFLGIDWLETNIKPMVDAFTVAIEGLESSAVAKTNLPARVRMTTLMGIGQTNNWLVANTCNLSEDFVGYATLWGDSCGSFAPISKLTTEEIIAIGKALGLPIDLSLMKTILVSHIMKSINTLDLVKRVQTLTKFKRSILQISLRLKSFRFQHLNLDSQAIRQV